MQDFSMRRAAAGCAALTAFTSFAFAGESILVLNPGFESPPYNLCAFAPAADWVAVGDGGAWRPGVDEECFYNGYPDGVPEGQQVGFINSGTSYLRQTLTAVLEPQTHYKLIVEVGRRQDCCQMDSYKIQLRAGEMLLVEDPGLLDPAKGTFETSVICFTTGAAHPAMGQALEIRLMINGGSQANFDDVRLEKGVPGDSCDAPVGIPGDLDGDGDVDGADLGQLLAAWGTCSECSACPADLTGDCVVNGADLGVLLANWG